MSNSISIYFLLLKSYKVIYNFLGFGLYNIGPSVFSASFEDSGIGFIIYLSSIISMIFHISYAFCLTVKPTFSIVEFYWKIIFLV